MPELKPKRLFNYFIQARNCPFRGDEAITYHVTKPPSLTHTGCGGEWKVVEQEFVDDEHPSVDVYRCDHCGQQTLQPDSPEIDAAFREMMGGE